jgi:hypothetical protein
MKKARIALTAIALFAVIGGALAIKATKFQPTNLYYRYTSNPTSFVAAPAFYPSVLGAATITTVNPTIYYSGFYTTTSTLLATTTVSGYTIQE